MKQYLLAPVGRAEPHDVQGWLEHGGGLALQQALAMRSGELRTVLNGVPRRDGQGRLHFEAGQESRVVLHFHPAPDPTSFVVEEIPAWLVEGILLYALACEQSHVDLHLDGASRDHVVLLKELISRLSGLGFIGIDGWAGGITLGLTSREAPEAVLDSVTALLLPLLLWHRYDPSSTLLAVDGAVHRPGVYEVLLDCPLEDVLAIQGNVPGRGVRLQLGTRTLAPSDWSLPLSYELFGRDLGSGRLHIRRALPK